MEQVRPEGEAAREEALASREAHVLARERDVARREEAVRQLTRALDDGRARLAAEADRDWVLGEMREMNQHLVLTALGAQTMAEEATDARAAAEAAHRVIEVAQQAMLRADRRKDEFLAMLGHELRNPLAPLLTAVELMKLRPDESCAREREVIERQVRHMMRLIDDLLDVTRITSGKVVLHRSVVELSAAVADAVELARPLVESRRHTLTVAVPAAGLTVDADPTRLAQVIANLLTNAAKYTEPGGAISVEAAREGDRVRLAVTDNGVGIPAELLPRVFDLFVQSSQTIERSRGGLGLGLAIVRNLAAGPVSFVPDPPAPKGGRGEGPARRVLVVDDNADAADMLAEALRSDARAVAIARDGLEALRAATYFEPDTVLIDIGLPVMDGYELAARLREREAQRPSAARLRLIAVTGYGQEADVRRSKAAGMDAHLVKPVRLDDLEAMLNAGPAA